MENPDDGRIVVPLRMIRGNLDILLENEVPCRAVSMKHDSYSHNGVILVFHGADHEACEELGFELRSE